MLALMGTAGGAQAAALKDAEFTRVINDVRTSIAQSPAVAARIGDRLSDQSTVSTGVDSRAEIKFADKTLTRLGANSIFRMNQATRTVEVEKGVILLQVPKQMGGAKVRTAAVTAAVTGTTIIVEFTPDGFIKIIVIEGEVDVFLNEDPGTFRTLKPGDLWITRANGKGHLPLPVQVDLDRLQKTSKLMDKKEFPPLGNEHHVQGALNDQSKKKLTGELLKTAFQIEGRGRRVTLTQGERQHIPGTNFGLQDRPEGQGGPPRPPGNGPNSPGSSAGTPRSATNIPGITVIDNESRFGVSPERKLYSAYNSLADVFVDMPVTQYFPLLDEPFNDYLFGDDVITVGSLDPFLNNRARWLVFKGDKIYIVGSPLVDEDQGPHNLALGASKDINLQEFVPFDREFETGSVWMLGSETTSLALTSGGSINFTDFSLMGVAQDVAFYAAGASSDINITGLRGEDSEGESQESFTFTDAPCFETEISFPEGSFLATAGRDINISNARIEAKTVSLAAGRAVNIDGGSVVSASESLKIAAKRNVIITNSSQLRALTESPQVFIAAADGNVEILNYSSVGADTVSILSQRGNLTISDSSILAREIKARVMDTGGTLMLNNAFLSGIGEGPASMIKLYGDGSGGVRFTGDTTLRGNSVTIAGKTVTIDAGSKVRLSNPSGTNVYSNTHNYNNTTHGRFTDSGGSTQATVGQQPHGNRPGF